MSLPAVVEQLLIDVVADGFTLYCCGPKTAPNALVASYEWDHHVDLLTVRNFDRVSTARVPKRSMVDIFAPEVVVWSYEGSPQWALRALLELVHPAHPAAPTADYPAPASLRVSPRPATPDDDQTPITKPSPSPGGPARHRDNAHSGDRATAVACVRSWRPAESQPLFP